jgi:predicted SAM-dependent methyltransferase
MKTTYIFLAFIGILMYNVALAKRDQQLFKAYDAVCQQLPQPHPDCRYSK